MLVYFGVDVFVCNKFVEIVFILLEKSNREVIEKIMVDYVFENGI